MTSGNIRTHSTGDFRSGVVMENAALWWGRQDELWMHVYDRIALPIGYIGGEYLELGALLGGSRDARAHGVHGREA